MKWKRDGEQIFVDWPEERGLGRSVTDKTKLAPAAFHCPNPSSFQSFHFGVHKAVKVTQYGCQNFRYYASVVHWDNLSCLVNNFMKTRSIFLAFSILGAWESLLLKYTFSEVDFDFGNLTGEAL